MMKYVLVAVLLSVLLGVVCGSQLTLKGPDASINFKDGNQEVSLVKNGTTGVTFTGTALESPDFVLAGYAPHGGSVRSNIDQVRNDIQSVRDDLDSAGSGHLRHAGFQISFVIRNQDSAGTMGRYREGNFPPTAVLPTNVTLAAWSAHVNADISITEHKGFRLQGVVVPGTRVFFDREWYPDTHGTEILTGSTTGIYSYERFDQPSDRFNFTAGDMIFVNYTELSNPDDLDFVIDLWFEYRQ